MTYKFLSNQDSSELEVAKSFAEHSLSFFGYNDGCLCLSINLELDDVKELQKIINEFIKEVENGTTK